jgi:hypothetical protein
LRRFGFENDIEKAADAGKNIIDFCCCNLTPFGTFWGKYSRDNGWSFSWPSPERMGPRLNMGAHTQELQSRTLADATLFTARAALQETDTVLKTRWASAVCSNLDYLCKVQRMDGNPGEAYSGTDGSVIDWDGQGGLHWISALVEGYGITGDPRYLESAERAGGYFRAAVEDAYLTGAPESMHLLPTSEDPQNAVIAYMSLWKSTRDISWLDLARKAADLLMTFRWQYNTSFDAMSILGRYDFRTKGLDTASPNNVHLHPYGLVAVPELVELWEETGDAYIIRQVRNNLLGCHQMLAPEDGAFGAMRGMMSERWYQTPCKDSTKGSTLQVSHAWAIGLVLYADLWIQKYGQILIDGLSGELIVLEALNIECSSHGWTLMNPWDQQLSLGIVVRQGMGVLSVDGLDTIHYGGTVRHGVELPPHGHAVISWRHAILPSTSLESCIRRNHHAKK